MTKKLVLESVENILEWLLTIAVCGFITSAVAYSFTGSELTTSHNLVVGLLFERAIAAFAFVYNRTRSEADGVGEGNETNFAT